MQASGIFSHILKHLYAHIDTSVKNSTQKVIAKVNLH